MRSANDTIRGAGGPPTALVTGASRGFGLATSRALAARGWRLVVDARDGTTLAAAAADLREDGAAIEALAGDVADPDHRRALVGALGGRLDLLVNNASHLGPSPLPALAGYPLDELRRVYEVNVVAPLALVQEVLPLLRARRGTIVNVTSDAAREQYAGWGGYGSSKAALEQLSNVLAAEEPDVTVVWFDPGDMNTDMHQAAFPGEDISDRPPPEASVLPLLRLLERAVPSGRYAVGDEVGAA